jgi:hypothetical protein
MQSTSAFLMYANTPILNAVHRRNSGVTQYGLKPMTDYQYAHPTMLVNFGKATTMDRIAQRRSRSGKGSSPSLDGLAMGHDVPKMLGLSKKPDAGSLQFCSQETMALRLCMAKGESSCEKENNILEQCLGRVAPLREGLEKTGRDYVDWFIQNVSDNYTKPFSHRKTDHKLHYNQEMVGAGGKRGYQRNVNHRQSGRFNNE